MLQLIKNYKKTGTVTLTTGLYSWQPVPRAVQAGVEALAVPHGDRGAGAAADGRGARHPRQVGHASPELVWKRKHFYKMGKPQIVCLLILKH